MSHTKEPWSFNGRQEMRGNGDILPLLGISIPMTYGPRQLEAKANARRIVACVNACEGVQTETLERVPLNLTTKKMVARIEQTEKERDQLRELCGELLESNSQLVKIIESAGISNLMRGVQLGNISWSIKCQDAIDYSKSAIIKAERVLGGK